MELNPIQNLTIDHHRDQWLRMFHCTGWKKFSLGQWRSITPIIGGRTNGVMSP